jgi:predicted PurR-regulated permease PerM
VSILVAFFLDPVVEWLERFRVPRGVGALIVLLAAALLLTLLVLSIWDRVDDFMTNWPKYREPLRAVTASFEERLASLEARFSELQTKDKQGVQEVKLKEESPVRSFLTRGLGSAYVILLAGSFVPFLVFFMLAEKRAIWHATMQLFPPSERTTVKLALEDLTVMLRSYIVGNLVVALILGVMSSLFFWIMDLGNPLLMGLISGFLNLVPYLGTVMSWLPPFVVALAKFKTFTPFLLIASVLTAMHLVAVNVLIPAIVGKQVRLNALAVTISLLFWGWIWGGMGLLLGIPITATVKVVCDHVEDWRPFGRWLST